MSEVEKMQELLRRVQSPRERQLVSDGMDVMAQAFRQLIFAVGESVRTGKRALVSMDEVEAAYSSIRDLGRAYGIAFPAPDGPRELLQYVAEWGREILFMHKDE